MSDTNCTRAGYDASGRYHVPPLVWDTFQPRPEDEQKVQQSPASVAPSDQCPECRTPPGRPHAEDCPGCALPVRVPLHEQVRRYFAHIEGVLDELQAKLARGTDYRARVVAEGYYRLVDGYDHYGSNIYNLTLEQIATESLQEVADYGVYEAATK